MKTLIKFISTRKDRGRINNHYVQSSKKQAGGGCDFEKNSTMIMSEVKICITITIIIYTIHHSHFFQSKASGAINILKENLMVFEKLSKQYDLVNLSQVFKSLYKNKNWMISLQIVWLYAGIFCAQCNNNNRELASIDRPTHRIMVINM